MTYDPFGLYDSAAASARRHQRLLAIRAIFEIQAYTFSAMRAYGGEFLFLLNRFQDLFNGGDARLIFEAAVSQVAIPVAKPFLTSSAEATSS
jgi:hypothetical protein